MSSQCRTAVPRQRADTRTEQNVRSRSRLRADWATVVVGNGLRVIPVTARGYSGNRAADGECEGGRDAASAHGRIELTQGLREGSRSPREQRTEPAICSAHTQTDVPVCRDRAMPGPSLSAFKWPLAGKCSWRPVGRFARPPTADHSRLGERLVGLLGGMPDPAIVREFRDRFGQRFEPVGELVVEHFCPRAPVVDLIGATHLDGNDSDRRE